MQNAPAPLKILGRCDLVAWGGIEPPTQGFSILCTPKHSCAIERYSWEYFYFSEWLAVDFSGVCFPRIPAQGEADQSEKGSRRSERAPQVWHLIRAQP